MATLVYTVTVETGGNAPTELEAAHLKTLFEEHVADYKMIEGGASLAVASIEEQVEG